MGRVGERGWVGLARVGKDGERGWVRMVREGG